MGYKYKIILSFFLMQCVSATELHASVRELRTSYFKVAKTVAKIIHEKDDSLPGQTSTQKTSEEELTEATQEFAKLCGEDESCAPALFDRIDKMGASSEAKQQLLAWVIAAIFASKGTGELTNDQILKFGVAIAASAFYFSGKLCDWTAQLISPYAGDACKLTLGWLSSFIEFQAKAEIPKSKKKS